MKKTKWVTKQFEEVENIICNKCGVTLRVSDNPETFNGLNGYAYGVYGSKYLTDQVDYKFDLCEKCLVELFETFKIPVEKENENEEY